MSATALTALTALPAPRRGQRPRLRALERPVAGRRPRLLYGIVAVATAIAIAGAQMGLSILTTQSSYEVAALTEQQRELTWQTQMLRDDVAGLSSPQFLAANAAALGMVVAESPNYLRLSDGAIIGDGQAAAGVSSVDALSRAAVPNALVGDTPLVTDPEASLGRGAAADTELLLNTPTPPAIADGLPTPATH
ncbi:hypothetical protein [Microbacterium sp.]|uniref:hypothetical protein n=1 Tax=Microbacterium sp. TaxID=51671 RepID=UPI0039E53E54